MASMETIRTGVAVPGAGRAGLRAAIARAEADAALRVTQRDWGILGDTPVTVVFDTALPASVATAVFPQPD